MARQILVVDDDEPLAEMIGIVLSSEGYEPTFCFSGSSAIETFHQSNPDLILLDLMLPDIDGIEVCRQIRQESNVPVIMLTAKSDTEDVVAGLEAGADDYIPKPFKPKELIARVKTRLRQTGSSGEDDIDLGDVHIDLMAHEATRAGRQLNLTPIELGLLSVLARQPWKAFSREELLEEIWGYRHSGDTRLVNVHIQRLRSKIEDDPDDPKIIKTVRGVGYRASAA
ncbi:MAG: MtrAB system response regulator MtrA [Varibaculum sp.]|nr:MtrAB system response regulator MtrA [Varibaculum sp.]